MIGGTLVRSAGIFDDGPHTMSPEGHVDAGDMAETCHGVFLLGEARRRFFGSARSKSASFISGGAMLRIQSVRRRVRQTSRSVTVEAFFPFSRFRRAETEMPLRAANVSSERLSASRAERMLAPSVCSISCRVRYSITVLIRAEDAGIIS